MDWNNKCKNGVDIIKTKESNLDLSLHKDGAGLLIETLCRLTLWAYI